MGYPIRQEVDQDQRQFHHIQQQHREHWSHQFNYPLATGGDSPRNHQLEHCTPITRAPPVWNQLHCGDPLLAFPWPITASGGMPRGFCGSCVAGGGGGDHSSRKCKILDSTFLPSSLSVSVSVTLLWCLPCIDWMCKHWSGDSLNFLIWGLGNRRRTEWKRIWCCWAVSEPQPGIDQLTVVATKSLVLTRKQWRKAHRRWTVKEGTKCQLSQSNGRLNCSLRQDHP